MPSSSSTPVVQMPQRLNSVSNPFEVTLGLETDTGVNFFVNSGKIFNDFPYHITKSDNLKTTVVTHDASANPLEIKNLEGKFWIFLRKEYVEGADTQKPFEITTKPNIYKDSKDKTLERHLVLAEVNIKKDEQGIFRLLGAINILHIGNIVYDKRFNLSYDGEIVGYKKSLQDKNPENREEEDSDVTLLISSGPQPVITLRKEDGEEVTGQDELPYALECTPEKVVVFFSKGSQQRYVQINIANGEASVLIKKDDNNFLNLSNGGSEISGKRQGKLIGWQSVKVCVGGQSKTMLVLGSAPE